MRASVAMFAGQLLSDMEGLQRDLGRQRRSDRSGQAATARRHRLADAVRGTAVRLRAPGRRAAASLGAAVLGTSARR